MIGQDSNRHKGMRNQLVSTIKRKGISDKNVLEAISKVPRHLFMDSSFVDFAYQEKPNQPLVDKSKTFDFYFKYYGG